MEQSKMKKGFTLAEVLITLAVIGIVAAMTIPNLVQSYKKKEVETKLVKFYSIMNNAIRMAEVDYGPQSTWSDYYEGEEVDEDGNQLFQKGDKFDAHINKYFAPYIKITGSEEIRRDNELKSGYKIYYLSDGSAFAFALNQNRDIYFFPSNPKKCISNMKLGKCTFVFAFFPYHVGGRPSSGNHNYNYSNGMQPALFLWNGNEESLMTNATYGCKNGNGWYCTEVIRRNGWKIPEDYPFKF